MSDSKPALESNTPASDWPEGGLESVPVCPVCRAPERTLVHRGLRDRAYRSAPGEWNIYCCTKCGSGFPDPRPTAETIGLAYSRYFTHSSAAGVDRPPSSLWRRYRTAQRNAYLNRHFGYQLSPAGKSPRWLSEERRQRFDKQIGYLPYPGKGARLLDVGCGNGRFLLQMRAAGWDVAGVEPDPNAVSVARVAGLDVKGGLLEQGSQPDDHFDAITMNHVIEHLHDPVQTLKECARILKPGGRISISTPNFDAQGHKIFGSDWFPLQPPSHLVLFTPASLRLALCDAGFEPDLAIQLRLTAGEMFLNSMHLREGGDPIGRTPALSFRSKLKLLQLVRTADAATRLNPELTEEIVLLARKGR